MDRLSSAIKKARMDAYVMYASSRDADMRYLTRFTSSDPYVFFKKPGETGTIIISQMETGRASRESVAAVMTRAQAGLPDIMKTEKDPYRATAKMIAAQAGKKILVPPNFPLALAEALNEFCSVVVDRNTVALMRSRKDKNEIRMLKSVQKITETAMGVAVSMIREASVKRGVLFSGGKPLTSERVKFAIHCCLLEHGCSAVDSIVSCGEDTAVPHITGTGPLRANQPIVIDIFPFDERTGYYADMTRTVSKGTPSEEILAMFSVLREAQELAISRVRAGIQGSDVHQAVVDFFKDHGYESNTHGFIHNLGHGVGLQVHELPTVGPSGTALEPGNIITIEPGLYYPGIGGVRLEDVGVVTRKGFDDFTNFEKELVL